MSSNTASHDATLSPGPAISPLTQLAESALKRREDSVAFTSRVRDQDALAKARLGLACSLFVALRCRHPPTAAHSLRVALSCSVWGLARQMSERDLDDLEIAALLHDLGKIGVPDSVLCKPLRLTHDERQIMSLKRPLGMEMLQACSANREVVEILDFCNDSYQDAQAGRRKQGADLPLAARMLHIVDAFDSMTTDHVYRPAMSPEAAVDSLRHAAGAQFDPELVEEFVEIKLDHAAAAHRVAARRWLTELADRPADCWTIAAPVLSTRPSPNEQFQRRLLESTREGVFFVERSMRITYWNPALERITGVTAESVVGMQWDSTLLGLATADGAPIGAGACPISIAAAGGGEVRVQASIQGPIRRTPVRLEVASVTGDDRAVLGAAVLMRDLSGETNLREQVEDMQEMARRDPMTAALNRRAMDELHEQFAVTARESASPYSVIITDIDHFKRINDNYGHHAGDEAIRSFVGILKHRARGGEHVARYGGEEFVVLCPEATVDAAAELAEEIRSELAASRLGALQGAKITASFGVTQLQEGDSASTMMRRADRALIRAKESGRNRVEQLGRNAPEVPEATMGERLFAPRSPAAEEQRWECNLSTRCSGELLVEKLRGFVADHEASVLEVDEELVELLFEIEQGAEKGRRLLDRRVALLMTVTFRQEAPHLPTQLTAVVQPHRRRDRRRVELEASANRLIASLRAYLMAEER